MSSDPIPIYEGQEFYVPHFVLKLNQHKASDKIISDTLQVSYKDKIESLDSFELTINNWDAEKRDFKYSDQELFDPGNKIELWMGYYGKDSLRLMLRGVITSLRPTFPAAGQPTLAISGQNLLHDLRGQQRSRTFEDKKDSDIATQIGRDLGIEVRTNAQAKSQEVKHNYMIQDNQYDLVFLMERARRLGYDLLVEEDGANGRSKETTLYFGPSQGLRNVTYQLDYGRSLIQFQPTLNTAQQVSEVTVIGWDNINKKKITVTVERDGLRTKGVGASAGQKKIEQSFSKRKEIITDRPVQNEDEAKILAREILERNTKDMVKGSGSTVGLPDLRAGSVITIGGLGKRFSGRYFVTGTTHSIGDSGYTTRFECRREEI